MTPVQLDALPKELISLIALNSDALSIIRLAQTCRTVRSACYDKLVFRELLARTQSSLWTTDSLDIETIEKRCGKDVSLWARFALADQHAWTLSQRECLLDTPERFLHWLPELFVVKHPFMLHQCWQRFMWDPRNLTTKQMFCFAMAILATDDPMLQLERSLKMQEDEFIKHNESSKAYFFGLCFMMINVRKLLRTRRAAWPYNHAAQVPYISLPSALEIDLTPTSSAYKIPTPFASSTLNSLDWDAWYAVHGREMFQDHLLNGTWRGYYTYFGNFFGGMGQLDPPMVDIRFARREVGNGVDDGEFEIIAENCRDGVAPFGIVGSITQVDGDFTFLGYKAYGDAGGMGAGVTWAWKLKCTVLGLVGYWGVWGVAHQEGELERNGSVWLWKEPA